MRFCLCAQCCKVTVGVWQYVEWSGVICIVTGFCTVQVQRLQASKYCMISLTSDVALAIETKAVTSALVSYPDPSARRSHLVLGERGAVGNDAVF